ncbi:MAG: sulfite exporter TauE/SafE family protein [Oleiphilus sp.]|nr:MAG: sulfite exporter TauE/SafE family protein [Oleiphilus sp.]
MDSGEWLIAALSLAIGCWIQTALGFGMAVVAAPVIVFFAPEWVPIPLTVTALVLSLFNTLNQYRALEWQALKIPFLTRIPGTIVGAWLLLQIDQNGLQFAVAFCVLLAVLVSWFGKQFSYTPRRLGLAAFISGIMGTTTSVGGPPMALVMQHGRPATVRANLSLYFGYSCTLSLISYAWIGKLNEHILLVSASFIPVAALGFLLGIRSRTYVDTGRFRPLLLVLCSLSGAMALAGAIWDS